MTVRRDGKSHTERQSYTTTVVDFDFTIDCDKYVLPNVVHWSVGDTDPAYRGRMVKDLSITGGPMRKAKRKENKQYSNYRKQLEASGLPPWLANIDGRSTQDGLKSSKSMREWADDYCASPKHLKEFVYVKVSAHLSCPPFQQADSGHAEHLRLEIRQPRNSRAQGHHERHTLFWEPYRLL